MAIDTTRRRFASTMCCLAAMSPRSMRLARETSSSAVSSGTRPMERRYRRSESSDGSTVRSIAGFFGASSGTAARRASAAASTLRGLRRRGAAVGADDVDALLVELAVELGDLLLGDLDLLERASRSARRSGRPSPAPRRSAGAARRARRSTSRPPAVACRCSQSPQDLRVRALDRALDKVPLLIFLTIGHSSAETFSPDLQIRS